MARCVYCGLRKGKRQCPALDDVICSQCCGEHRLREIACPATCSWLGGLQAVVDPAKLTAEISEQDWLDGRAGLFATFDESLGAPYLATALEHFALDDEPEEWVTPVLVSYAALALRDASGYRLVDRYMESRGRDLPPAHGATILVLQRSWASLLEITAVREGEGLTVEDLITGAEHDVRDVELASVVEIGDQLFAWLGERGDHLEITAGLCLISPLHSAAILKDFTRALELEREMRPDEPDGVLAAELAWQLVRAIQKRESTPTARVRDLADGPSLELEVERMHDHLAGWLDTRVPALGDRTPRQAAAASPADQRTVARMLSLLEEHTRALPGGDAVDFAAQWRELGLEYDPDILSDYRADQPPDAELWSNLDEAERIELVEEYHSYLSGPHPEPDNPRLHATIHVVVENQIAAGDPPQTAAAMQRLMEQGLSRHEALHAVGSVVAKMIFRVLHDREEADEDTMQRELASLEADDWLNSSPV